MPSITFIIVEQDHATGFRRLHKVVMPRHGKSQDITSINAFTSGTRAAASVKDKEFYHDTCCWGPQALYLVKHEQEWRDDLTFWMASFRKAKIDLRDHFIKTYGVDSETIDDIPVTTHDTIYDFYKAIRFDYKSRRYLDPVGKPIKYSLLD